MTGVDRRVSDLIDTATFIRFYCPGCRIRGAHYFGSDLRGKMQTLTPRDVIKRHGDVYLSDLERLQCDECGSPLDYIGYIDRESLMRNARLRDYVEDTFTQYLVMIAVLAVAALGLMALSTTIPREWSLILIPSVLISATIIATLLVVFNYWDRFKLAVVLFEENVRMVALVISFALLAAVLLGFAAWRVL